MIQVLPEEVIRTIAAGEVIERPASIVKELLENGLDASSSQITLEISGNGKDFIRISDNGIGIPPDELKVAIERHATSKITKAQDLENLSTFGFRGEALPSIAQVSKMKIVSRSQEHSAASEISIEGGKILFQKECGRDHGTTVEVTELFFNTPARLKFLKAAATERQHILRTFEEAALSHPEVWFELKMGEGKTKQSYPTRNISLERVRDIWGEDFNEENLIPLDFSHPYLKISGWVSKPQFHQATKGNQIFFINKRPIFSRSLTHALYESYRDCLPVGRHPVGLIFLDVDPSQIDFNVHPTKREVRFRNESQIHEALKKEIRTKRAALTDSPKLFLDGNTVRPEGSSVSSDFKGLATVGEDSERNLLFAPARPNRREETSDWPSNSPLGTSGARSGLEQRRPNLSEVSSRQAAISLTKSSAPNPTSFIKPQAKVLAQYQALYILAEEEGNLLIVDQHAAAERVLYEKFKKSLSQNENVPTQTMLLPYHWNVSLSQVAVIGNHLETFKKLGFSMDLFGDKTFRIVEIPALIPEKDLESILQDILQSLENQSQVSLAVEEKIMHAACRAAIKANDPLTNEELSKLLEELRQCSNPHTCPHGRPITLTLTRTELDKKFGRI